MLSWIASDFFARSPVLLYPLVALGLFMTVFVAVALRAFLGNAERFEALAQLPFEKDEVDDHV
jgi:hypothetical protein